MKIMSNIPMPTLKDNLETIQQKARERTVKTQNVEYDLETLIKRLSSRLSNWNQITASA